MTRAPAVTARVAASSQRCGCDMGSLLTCAGATGSSPLVKERAGGSQPGTPSRRAVFTAGVPRVGRLAANPWHVPASFPGREIDAGRTARYHTLPPSRHARFTMSDFSRRQFLKGVLGAMLQAAGSVVLASAAAPAARGGERPDGGESPPESPQQRADRLAAAGDFPAEAAAEAAEFRNFF